MITEVSQNEATDRCPSDSIRRAILLTGRLRARAVPSQSRISAAESGLSKVYKGFFSRGHGAIS